ncbi:hypothetical protein, partial [Klebsiella quasipneumoniae]|uniref:hypothetical protein n=1 Tax=Klebsiella quasipneumoniae TaxID=1463165 RepID=UPI00272F473E
GTNPLHPNVVSNPAARVFKGDLEQMGKAEKFPYVGTTYRLTEHFHYWTKHALLNAIAQPEQFGAPMLVPSPREVNRWA